MLLYLACTICAYYMSMLNSCLGDNGMAWDVSITVMAELCFVSGKTGDTNGASQTYRQTAQLQHLQDNSSCACKRAQPVNDHSHLICCHLSTDLIQVEPGLVQVLVIDGILQATPLLVHLPVLGQLFPLLVQLSQALLQLGDLSSAKK